MMWVKVCSRAKSKLTLRRSVADCPACTVYGEVLVVQRQVAEPGHQHANEEKAQSEGQDGRNESPPCIDADGIVAQYQEHKE